MASLVKPRVFATMSPFKALITRHLPVPLAPLAAIATIDLWPQRRPPPYDVLRSKLQDCDGLLCLLTDPIDQALMATAPRLKVISQFAVGYDNIDVAAATARGIPVGHTPGVLTDATADLTWALLMAAARQVVAGDRFIRTGQWRTWEPDLLLGPQVAGATLGIIGLGRIGQAVARRAQGFKMRLLYHGRHRLDPELERVLGVQWVTLETLLAQSDFVTLHTPLSDQTAGMISDRQFELMQPHALLINTARGPIVDPQALYRALSTGKIAGAALDATEPEPLPSDSPLLHLQNLIVTPHIGSASRQTRLRMGQMALANLIAGLQGDPLPHCVNPEVYVKP